MQTYIVTLWNPEDGETYLAADGALTACEACAARFADIHHAEAAAERIVRDGWAYAIEENEL
jgi:uncharacterized Zn ribbon protein